jgi:hypothetical protein
MNREEDANGEYCSIRRPGEIGYPMRMNGRIHLGV